AMVAIDARFAAANGRRIREQEINRIVFGHWRDANNHREEAIVCRTSQAEIEVHCHGGPAAVERIIGHFAEADCETIPWQQWLERQTPDKITAEAKIALVEATTLKTSAVLLQQHGGALRNEIQRIQQLIDSGEGSEALERVNHLIARIPFGLHLTKPWRVVIAGRPNVGKSSLINALVGYQRAIVYDQPGTTRDVVSSVTALEGWPVALFDVAGLRETGEPLEAAGIALARETIAAADLVLWVEEVDSAMSVGDSEFEQTVASEVNQLVGQPLAGSPLVVLNKCDKLGESTQAWRPELLVSALTGEGIPELIEEIIERLIPFAPEANEPIPFTQRQSTGLTRLAEELESNQLEAAVRLCDELLGHELSAKSQ
ncbi:MAG: GTPase, partial [Lacipirellulaceae bacterium]